MNMLRWSPLTLVFAVACAGAPPGASYSGSRERPLVRAEQVRTAETVPPGYERLGRVSVRCKILHDLQALDREPLANVDCSEQRLDRALRERAAEVGGELLTGRECHRTLSERHCEARVARSSDEALEQRRLEAAPPDE